MEDQNLPLTVKQNIKLEPEHKRGFNFANNSNSYFFNNLELGEKPKPGRWSKEEKQKLLQILNGLGDESEIKWGILLFF